MSEKELLYKIDHNIKLTEKEIQTLIESNPFDEPELIETHRWDILCKSTFNIGDRFFQVVWCKGSTEMQESFYPNQPYEVILVTTVKEVQEYIPVKTNYGMLRTMSKEDLAKWILRHGDDFGSSDFCILECENRDCATCVVEWLELNDTHSPLKFMRIKSEEMRK